MIGYPDAPQAWSLTRGMARLIGLDLPQAVMDGWLSRNELAVLLAACDDCSARGPCSAWLSGAGHPHEMPGFCPNKPGLEALAP